MLIVRMVHSFQKKTTGTGSKVIVLRQDFANRNHYAAENVTHTGIYTNDGSCEAPKGRNTMQHITVFISSLSDAVRTERNNSFDTVSNKADMLALILHCWIFSLRLLMLNNEIRQDTTKLLTANLCSAKLDLDWSWKNSPSTLFAECSWRRSSTSERWDLRTGDLGQIFKS